MEREGAKEKRFSLTTLCANVFASIMHLYTNVPQHNKMHRGMQRAGDGNTTMRLAVAHQMIMPMLNCLGHARQNHTACVGSIEMATLLRRRGCYACPAGPPGVRNHPGGDEWLRERFRHSRVPASSCLP